VRSASPALRCGATNGVSPAEPSNQLGTSFSTPISSPSALGSAEKSIKLVTRVVVHVRRSRSVA